MPDDAKRSEIESIIGRSLLTAETFASELRRRIVSKLSRVRDIFSPSRLLDLARDVLDEFEPILAQAMTDAELAAWVAGTNSVVRILPAPVRQVLEGAVALAPAGPPGGLVASLLAGGADEPIIRFPLIERAAESLLERNIVTRSEFDILGQEARSRALTVAAQESEDAIATIRDVLAETISEGASLSEFRKRLGEGLDGSFIGPSHRENVYRTNIQAAFHQAHDELADDPIVSEVFPYQEYLPIKDGRVREEHLALATLGLNGTGIYRRDDKEFWSLFTPPWGYMCRCGVNLLSVEAAARKGVVEARRWERTGVPPIDPEHRLQDIPFRPEGDFVGGLRLSMENE